MKIDSEIVLKVLVVGSLVAIFATTFVQPYGDLSLGHQISLFWYQFFLGVCAIGVLCGRGQHRDDSKSKAIVDTFDVITVIIFIAIAISIGVFHIQALSIWTDEHAQVIRRALLVWTDGHAQVIQKSGPLSGAAIQQQPPAGYFLLDSVVKIWGLSEHSVRFPSVLFFSMTVAVTYLTARTLDLPKLLSLVPATLVLSNEYLLRYSIEGRPFSMGCFFLTLGLFSLVVSYRREPKSILNWSVLSTSFLFFFTSSLQPIFVSMYLLLINWLWKTTTTQFKKQVTISWMLGAIASVPAIIAIVVDAIPQNQFYGSHAYSRFLELALGNWEWWLYVKLFFSMMPEWMWISLTVIFVRVISSVATKKYDHLYVQLLILFSGIFLPILYIFIFKTFVNWSFANRYFLGFVVLYSLTHAFVFAQALKDFGLSKNWKEREVATFALIGLAIWYSALKIKYFEPSKVDSYANQSREAYLWIGRESEQKKSLVTVFTIVDLPHWEPDIAVGIDFYLPEQKFPNIESFYHQRHIDHTNTQSFKFASQLSQGTQFDYIFVLIGPAPPMPDQSFDLSIEKLGIIAKKFDNYEVLKIAPRGEDPARLLFDYLITFRQLKKPNSESYKIDELLTYLACIRRERGALELHQKDLSSKIDLKNRQHQRRLDDIEKFIENQNCLRGL